MLSPKQREMCEREALILEAARDMLLNRGYYGITMDKIADVSDCPKGTLYQHFTSKEDIVIALACQCLHRRLEMMRRATAFPGGSRERTMAMGESVGLFTRLYPSDSRILHNATGPIREKASADRMFAITRIENETVALVRGILLDGFKKGELPLKDASAIDEIVFGIWALVDGAYTLIESGTPAKALGISTPFNRLYRVFNVLADGYGWRPLFSEIDWEETLAQVRRTIFAEEAQAVYGQGAWYGDGV